MRALFLAVLLIPSLAYAHPPRAGRSDLIHACVTAEGAVRLVGKAKLETCLAGETPQHWVRETVQEPANYATTIPWSPPGTPFPTVVNPYSGDGRALAIPCQDPNVGAVEDPALSRDLTTGGNPVVMAFTAHHRGLSDDTIRLFVYLDGQTLHGEITDAWLAPDRPTVYHKLIPVPAGEHRFSVYVQCQDRFALGFRYLDLYELR